MGSSSIPNFNRGCNCPFLTESHQRVHKSACTPLDQETVVVLKPSYLDMGPWIEPLTVSFNSPSLLPGAFGPSVHGGKNMIVKIQVPLVGSEDLLVYNEKRTFKCVVNRGANPGGYDHIETIIKEKGTAPKGISRRT